MLQEGKNIEIFLIDGYARVADNQDWVKRVITKAFYEDEGIYGIYKTDFTEFFDKEE